MIFDHIGLFVTNLAEGRQKLTAVIPIVMFSDPIDDVNLKVSVQFCTDSSGICYELVAPLGEDNPVSQVLRSGKSILNHVAYTVSDLEAKTLELRSVGAIPLGPPRPAVAFGGNRVVFFLSPLRFIIELIESP